MSGGRFRVTVDDIGNLEISSMIVDGILGRKMPQPTAAFCEIISAWVFQFGNILNELGFQTINDIEDETDDKTSAMSEEEVKLRANEESLINAVKNWKKEKYKIFRKYVVEDRDPGSLKNKDNIAPLMDTEAMDRIREKIGHRLPRRQISYYKAELFRLLRVQTRFKILLEKYARSSASQNWLMLRFWKNCFYRLTGGKHGKRKAKVQFIELDFHDKQELRKLWELKDGYIYAQNVVQLDGDVITRVNRRLNRDPQAGQMVPELLEFHRKNVEVAISNWQFIVDTIIQLGKAVGGMIARFIKPVKI